MSCVKKIYFNLERQLSCSLRQNLSQAYWKLFGLEIICDSWFCWCMQFIDISHGHEIVLVKLLLSLILSNEVFTAMFSHKLAAKENSFRIVSNALVGVELWPTLKIIKISLFQQTRALIAHQGRAVWSSRIWILTNLPSLRLHL